MLYILIIFAFTGSNGVAVTTAEFKGEEDCQYAANQIKSMSKSFTAICAKRGR